MKQTWHYMDYDYSVDTEVPKSYATILHDMVEYNDCYDCLDTFMTEGIGGGADVFLLMVWDGPAYTKVDIMERFVAWMTEGHMELMSELLEQNATLVSEAD